MWRILVYAEEPFVPLFQRYMDLERVETTRIRFPAWRGDFYDGSVYIVTPGEVSNSLERTILRELGFFDHAVILERSPYPFNIISTGGNPTGEKKPWAEPKTLSKVSSSFAKALDISLEAYWAPSFGPPVKNFVPTVKVLLHGSFEEFLAALDRWRRMEGILSVGLEKYSSAPPGTMYYLPGELVHHVDTDLLNVARERGVKSVAVSRELDREHRERIKRGAKEIGLEIESFRARNTY